MFEFRFYEIWRDADYTQRLLEGAWLSFELSTIGGALGFALGLGLAVAQSASAPAALRYLAVTYVEVIRNTPFIVQLFFVVFGLPLLLNYNWSFEASALLAMALNFSAYFAEVIRAGIESIHKGQLEAARSLCLNKAQIYKDIVLPQALANVFPSITSQFVFLFLTTGLISEVGVEDLTWAGRYVADRTFRDFEVFITLTVMYVLLVFVYLTGFNLLKRVAFPWWGKK